MVCNGFGRHWSGDETGTTGVGEIKKTPLDENQDSALELNDVHQVDEKPNKPGWETREVNAEDIRHRLESADYCQISLIEVPEWLGIRIAGDALSNVVGDIGATLHCDLCNSRQRLPLGIEREGKVTDDEDVRVIRNRQLIVDLNVPGAVSFYTSALGELTGEIGHRHACRPDYSFGRDALVIALLVFDRDAFGINRVHHEPEAQSGAKLFHLFLSLS